MKKLIFGFLEGKILIVLLALLAGVLVAGWGSAMQIRQNVAANADVVNVDSSALVEVERLRNLAESFISNARAYTLLGSKSIYDKQEQEKKDFTEGLARFVKENQSGEVQEVVKLLETSVAQEKDVFEQAMKFRDQQTESKAIGYFYQSKASTILKDVNENLDKIVKLQNVDLEASRARAREAGLEAQAQVPALMTWFTAAVAFLSLCLAFLVIRMLFVQRRFLRERDRLVNEATNAIIARDEVLAAVSRDFHEPLEALNNEATLLKTARDPAEYPEIAEAVQATTSEIQTFVQDIVDQKKADMGTLNLRLDQLDVAEVLEDAQMMLLPIAKKRDIKLQIDSAVQSSLAYFDRERIMRVLHNLIGNAIKFSERHGRILVKVKTDAEFVNISIVDNGTGIPQSQQAGLFENFWQAKKTADQGAGVGLAVVKTIIAAHGGTVRVDNTLGQGSTFTFTLPRRRPVNAPVRKPGLKRSARPPANPLGGESPTL